MKQFSIDCDIIKGIFKCKGVTRVDYRVSASGQGFHFVWNCLKRSCSYCSKIEALFDDPARYRHDLQRPHRHRRILWSSKGGRNAGPWHSVYKKGVDQ